MAPKISFRGAARAATRSCFQVETGEVRFLIDCDMLQGVREAPARNRNPFGFDRKSIDFVLLTHAHIDHSDLLPKLAKAGFTGPIFATEATADLLGGQEGMNSPQDRDLFCFAEAAGQAISVPKDPHGGHRLADECPGA